MRGFLPSQLLHKRGHSRGGGPQTRFLAFGNQLQTEIVKPRPAPPRQDFLIGPAKPGQGQRTSLASISHPDYVTFRPLGAL
jgi:hypothetical protein